MSAANFIKDTMNGLKEAQHITVAFVVIVVISLALRIWVRTRMIKQFGWDDWTMVLACVSDLFNPHVAATNSIGSLRDTLRRRLHHLRNGHQVLDQPEDSSPAGSCKSSK